MPRHLRSGLLYALVECLIHLSDDQESVSDLYKYVNSQLRGLRTQEYGHYCKRSLINNGPHLTLKQWRAAVADLHEAIQLAEMFEQEPGPMAAALRVRLLLDDGELPHIHGESADQATQERDGAIDGYWAVESICSRPLVSEIAGSSRFWMTRETFCMSTSYRASRWMMFVPVALGVALCLVTRAIALANRA